MGNKKNKNRASAKSFRGNQYASGNKKKGRKQKQEDQTTPHRHEKRKADDGTPLSRSAKKIRLEDGDIEGNDNFFFLMNFSILKYVIEVVSKHCATCRAKNPNVVLQHLDNERMGFSQKFKISCSSCLWCINTYTSPKIEKNDSPGQNRHTVNTLATIAFREIGKGHEAMKMFNSCMNMPPPMAKKAFASISDDLFGAYEDVANKSMARAADEVKEDKSAEINDCQVTIDGTWQKRGYASLNGAVIAASKEGKVIDFQIMSKHCMGCRIWKSREGTPAYDEWKLNHKCSINHKKSAGAMEADGAVAMFQRSVETHNLRYRWYIGDGDTEAFSKVKNSNPYGDMVPQKLECVGHVQKRLGTRLRLLRNNHRGKVLEDGKKILGKGRLTDKAINTLQNYYGMAIRQNTHSLFSMKKAVGAVLYHCSDITKEEVRHQFCPREPEGWCKWQSDKLKGTSLYKKKLNLPVCIKRLLEPIFRDLSADELLGKCLHGQTQNANEAFNAVLWQKCPKEIFVGRETLQLATNSAVIAYNDGSLRLGDVYKKLDIPVGKYFMLGATQRDKKRIDSSDKKSSEIGKKRRKMLRATKKGYIDAEKEAEGGDSYSAGSFASE